jgi:hypothetical protein
MIWQKKGPRMAKQSHGLNAVAIEHLKSWLRRSRLRLAVKRRYTIAISS